MLFEWTSELEIGIPLIDNQHKKLVDIINSIYNLSKNNQACNNELEYSDTLLETAFVKLFDYTNYHFQTEETLFEELNYENKENHKISHDRLREKLSDFYNNFAKYEQSNTEILEFLTHWLREHILIADKKYVNQLIAKKPQLKQAE